MFIDPRWFGYHILDLAYQTRGSRTGTSTPKPMNSLTAIAGHEGDEEDWERDMRGLSVNDEEVSIHSASFVLLLCYISSTTNIS